MKVGLVGFVLLFQLASYGLDKPQSCQTAGCHQSLGVGTYAHKPMKSERSCRVCHVEVSKGAGKKHPVFQKSDSESVNKTCYMCHEEVQHYLKGAKSVHDAIADKSCVSCHDPHGGKSQKLLKSADVAKMCLECHQNFGKKHLKGSLHRVSEMKNACLNCHDPHASRVNERLFRAANKKDLCLKCHEKEMGEWNKLAVENQHKPAAEGECQRCHKVHGSDQRALLASEYDLKPMAKESGANAQLCLKCHKDFSEVPEKKKVASGFRNGTQDLHHLHTMGLKQKNINCSACHDPHGSKVGFLMKDSFEYLGQQVSISYKKTKTGGTCATACHNQMVYDREREFKNEIRK